MTHSATSQGSFFFPFSKVSLPSLTTTIPRLSYIHAHISEYTFNIDVVADKALLKNKENNWAYALTVKSYDDKKCQAFREPYNRLLKTVS